jgi:hypothetical protein
MVFPVKFNHIFSSPVAYVAAAYLAALSALQAQEAVGRGFLIPGTIESNALGILLMSLMAIGPIAGVGLALWHIIHKVRLIESVLALLVAIPLLLIWAAAVSRILSSFNKVSVT